MLDTRALGNRIRELRIERGLTQSAFAEALHVSFQAISNWERGITPPELENLINIAAFFGVMIDDLLHSETENLYLGIDGGGTKTEFVLVTADGYVRKRITEGGCNPNDVGYDKTVALLTDGIGNIFLEYPSVKAVFCGIAGMSTGNYAKSLYDELKRRYPQMRIEVKNDAFNLFALDERANMAIISGTGSVLFLKNGDSYKRLGGWGDLFDTAGSGYDVGRDAVRVALGEEERQEPPSLLSTMLYKKLGVTTMWEHLGTLYHEGRAYVAGLASVVFEAYKKGDEKAAQIVENNAKGLADLLNAGAGLGGAHPLAVASGGLFEHYADILLPCMAKHTDVLVRVCHLPPVYGACRQSILLLEDNIHDGFEENFKNSYGGI
jgi:N-acetylglucosamine kinase-like BadF-type ATPase